MAPPPESMNTAGVLVVHEELH
ncbi:hypothetical protein A2U01_0117027, partial [Trifolium medium]|nr:hypothetical protein [Trifolium medium]